MGSGPCPEPRPRLGGPDAAQAERGPRDPLEAPRQPLRKRRASRRIPSGEEAEEALIKQSVLHFPGGYRSRFISRIGRCAPCMFSNRTDYDLVAVDILGSPRIVCIIDRADAFLMNATQVLFCPRTANDVSVCSRAVLLLCQSRDNIPRVQVLQSILNHPDVPNPPPAIIIILRRTPSRSRALRPPRGGSTQ